MDEFEKFIEWRKHFSMNDDGIAAYKALQALDEVRFEMATRGDGFLGRIEESIRE